MPDRLDDNPWRFGNWLLAIAILVAVCAFYAFEQSFAPGVSR